MSETVQLPEQFKARMEKELGPEYGAFIASYEDTRLYGLRCNLLKSDLEAFCEKMPFLLSKIDFAEAGFYYNDEERPGKHVYHEAGAYYIQEPSAMSAVTELDLSEGDIVLDLCAAPGGKSIAAALEGAKVLSCDVNALRLARCSENYQRLKLNIPTRQLDATEYCPDFHEAFDAVIADVPCSGSGVIRRHPEIRKRSLQEVEELLSLQSRILDNLAEYVRPGGTLLYSTCSVLQDENEKQLAAFLERKQVFRLTSTKLDGFDCENGMLRSWPHRNGNDGFFAARLVKKND